MSQVPLASLSRSVSFCAGLKLFNPHWSSEHNSQVYGRHVGPHGAEFILSVALNGLISPDDGMIVNLVAVKPQLAHVAKQLDGRFLDLDIEFFQQNRPTAENIARFCWNAMPKQIGNGVLRKLLLKQANRIQVEISAHSMKVSRSYEFAAAHRLFAPALTSEENWERFDKCSNRAGHGHNFQLYVWVEGLPDETGFIINPQLLDNIVEEEIYQRFDHKHLNEDCPEFSQGLIPTTENLALVVFDLLEKRLQTEGHRLIRVGLQETQKNYFEVGVEND